MICRYLTGIRSFRLGGVHRGGENCAFPLFPSVHGVLTVHVAMDVSADLFELTRCPVGLVSSGIKSILDIGRTLEYLVSCSGSRTTITH